MNNSGDIKYDNIVENACVCNVIVLQKGGARTPTFQTPMCFETLLKRLFDEYGLVMNFEQYVLVGSTVRSYLSWLKEVRAYFKTKEIDGRIQVRLSFCSKN